MINGCLLNILTIISVKDAHGEACSARAFAFESQGPVLNLGVGVAPWQQLIGMLWVKAYNQKILNSHWQYKTV